jgi:2',3'-cyclic-nucleotide 2'-phosphodiesterase (5'-nucleotidase family)
MLLLPIALLTLINLPLAKAGAKAELWELRIIHTSDQEAGKKALIDIPALVAVMEHLDGLPYPNTLKLTSGDLLIAGPFMNASQFLYSNPQAFQNLKPHQRSLEPLAMRPGIADMIINSNLGWQAAVIGNHEFDGIAQPGGVLNKGNFFELIGKDPQLRNYEGKGIGADAKSYRQQGAGIGREGYLGATFPYLSVNLDFDSFKANREGQSIFTAYGLKDQTKSPERASANSLARSTIIPVGRESIGVIGATTPFLPDIVGGLDPNNMLTGSYRSKEATAAEQAAVLRPLIKQEVDALQQRGINKIVLMTHLQDSAIEEELTRQLLQHNIGVDVVIGGGSHKVMGPANGAQLGLLRGLDQSSVLDAEAKARGEVVPALVPYPKQFTAADKQATIYYVNGGSNYEYLNQLIVRFDKEGRIVNHDPRNSRPWKTDGDAVSALLGHQDWRRLPAGERTQKISSHILKTSKNAGHRNAVATVNAVKAYIDGLDAVQYGLSKVWLNGNNGDIRSRETNLGNLVADSLLWYGQTLKTNNPNLTDIKSIDVAFINGGGIRDMIGTEQVMPDESVHRNPPEANPILNKQEGEISKLDLLNSLRFDNTLSIGTITTSQLKRSAEAMVAEARHGGFGQISGFRFSYDPNRPRGERVISMDLTRPRRLPDGRIDGSTQQQDLVRPLVRNGEVLRPDEELGVVTITYLAEGGDGQGGAQLSQNMRNVRWIGAAGDAATWQAAGQPKPRLLQATEAPTSISAGLNQRELGFGSYRDALGAYLTANHAGGAAGNPFAVADADDAGRPNAVRILVVGR